ncbi:uncharacterized protein LOC122401084 [Colletes gigas]|uniref:uncharacterized protein LOC122401084 n=1 Tax=Colletes gigas TaxID=935657 RepID=UPI001C9B33FF|nr:uncharacterized protein LOC122401084 [Colletes gigas]
MGSLMFFLSAVYVLTVLLKFGNSTVRLPITWEDFENGTDGLRILSREEWGARPPVAREPMVVTPTPFVVIHHGGIAQYCYDQTTCSAIVRSYQNFHIDDRGWYDIGYSFVIGEDGNAYEGRGWDYIGAHAPPYNNQSIGICVIGDFSNFLPNDAALKTLSALINYGVSLGKISKSYLVIGHRQARDTECPGSVFYKYVQTNPRWTKQPVPKYTPPKTTVESVTAVNDNANYKCLELKRFRGSVSSIYRMNRSISVFLVLTICQITFGSQHETPVRPNIISRSEWGAMSPKWAARNLREDPPPYVIIHHSATDGCTTQAICQARMRSFQKFHMNEKNWSDIGYNFVVGEDGNVYEGRGWDKHGSHSIPYNSKSIGICIIGNFDGHSPNAAAISATKSLISYGVSIGKIKDTYTLLGHRQTTQTICPGNSLYNLIKTWSRWSSNP